MSDGEWYPLRTKLTYIYPDENGHPFRMGDAVAVKNPYAGDPDVTMLRIDGEGGEIVEMPESQIVFFDIAG